MTELLNDLPFLLNWAADHWGTLLSLGGLIALLAANPDDTKTIGRMLTRLLIVFTGMKLEKGVHWFNERALPYIQRVTTTLDSLTDGAIEAYEQKKQELIKKENP